MIRQTETIPMREKKLRLSAVVLLALVVHALFVTFTHHHQALNHHRLSATPVISTDDHTPEEHLPQTRDDANCAACNLQRSLTAQIQPPIVQIEIGGQPLIREVHLLHSYLNPTEFYSAGRSPPLA